MSMFFLFLRTHQRDVNCTVTTNSAIIAMLKSVSQKALWGFSHSLWDSADFYTNQKLAFYKERFGLFNGNLFRHTYFKSSWFCCSTYSLTANNTLNPARKLLHLSLDNNSQPYVFTKVSEGYSLFDIVNSSLKKNTKTYTKIKKGKLRKM